MSWKIPLFKMYWDNDDITTVETVIKRGTGWAGGDIVSKFESKIAEYCGTKYAVVVNSGTSALQILLMAYEICKGDEVIVPSFTFIATANAPLSVGAKPVFADIEESSLGLDPDRVERKINPRTKAIIPIHFGGYPCLIEELKEIANKHNIILLEDAAESMGARINGKKVGTFGASSVLSFCENKIITTGEGGAIITDSRAIYQKLILLRSHGRPARSDFFSSNANFDYLTLGYNFRMSNIAAALGLAQIRKIDRLIELRRSNADYMIERLSKLEGISLIKASKQAFSVYQMFPIRIKGKKKDRESVQRYLASKGILTRVYFDPVHLSKFYKKKFGYKKGELPVTETVSEQILTLPMYPSLKKEEVDYITYQLERYFQG